MTETSNVDPVTAGLVKGIGKLLSSYREEHGLSRREMGPLLGLSPMRVQQIELGTQIGKGGITLATIVKIAELKKTDVLSIMKEIIMISPDVDLPQTPFLDDLSEIPSNQAIKTFISHAHDENPIFGNKVRWALDLSSLLLKTSDKVKAEIEMAVLKTLRDNKSDVMSLKDNKKRTQELLEFSLDALD